jgi:alanine racemase
MEEFANQAKTIPYEIMTSISKRVHRIYLEG